MKDYSPTFVVKGGLSGFGADTPIVAVDVEKSTGNVYAKFGLITPIYIQGTIEGPSGDPSIGFNTYYSGGWKFGKGSSANYCGLIDFAPSTGLLTYWSSAATGNADAAATVAQVMSLSRAGVLNLTQLTALQFVKTDSSKNLVSDSSSYCSAIWSKTASTTVSNTTTNTTFFDTGVGSKTIAGGTVRAGTMVRIKCSGEYGTKAAAVGSFTFTFYVGGASASVVCSGLPASVGTGHWNAEANFTFRTIGATATCVGEARVFYGNTVTADGLFGDYSDSSSSSVDTTGSLAVDAKIEMATASASNLIKGYQATIEFVNN